MFNEFVKIKTNTQFTSIIKLHFPMYG